MRRKYIAVIMVVLSAFFMLSCCNLSNKLLRNKMVKYYSFDQNYQLLQGEVIIPYVFEAGWYGEGSTIIKILTPEHNFRTNAAGELDFKIYANVSIDLLPGDVITFVSAPMYFYNGHELPIVALKKGDTEYLSFAEGKQNYLDWINNTFD